MLANVKYLTAAAAAAVVIVGLARTNAQDKNYDIVTVVKISGIQWFNRMEEGVKKFAADTGYNAYQLGPANADAQLQVQVLEDAIVQGVDAITVVPLSPEALEPVLKKAMEAGIKVAVLTTITWPIFQREGTLPWWFSGGVSGACIELSPRQRVRSTPVSLGSDDNPDVLHRFQVSHGRAKGCCTRCRIALKMSLLPRRQRVRPTPVSLPFTLSTNCWPAISWRERGRCRSRSDAVVSDYLDVGANRLIDRRLVAVRARVGGGNLSGNLVTSAALVRRLTSLLRS
jgi:Periplasmic binding protein domain